MADVSGDHIYCTYGIYPGLGPKYYIIAKQVRRAYQGTLRTTSAGRTNRFIWEKSGSGVYRQCRDGGEEVRAGHDAPHCTLGYESRGVDC